MDDVSGRHTRRQAWWITGITLVVILGLAIGLPLGLLSGNNGAAHPAAPPLGIQGPASTAVTVAPTTRPAIPFTAVFDLQFVTAEDGWVLGKVFTPPLQRFALAVTSDAGKNWEPVLLPNGFSVTSVRPNRDGSVTVFGPDRAYVSRDRGTTWTPIAGLHGNIVDMSVAGSSVWALLSQCPAGSASCRPTLWTSSDSGRSWHMPGSQPVMGNGDGQVAQSGPGSGWVISLDASDGHHSLVMSWRAASGRSSFPITGGTSVPECLDVRIVSASGSQLELLCNRIDGSGWKLLTTADAGHTWALRPVPSAPSSGPSTVPSAHAPLYHCVDSDHCWVALSPAPSHPGYLSPPTVWRTTDGGKTWGATGALD